MSKFFVGLLVLVYVIPAVLALFLTLLEGKYNRWRVKELYPFMSKKRQGTIPLTPEDLLYRTYMPIWNILVVRDFANRSRKGK